MAKRAKRELTEPLWERQPGEPAAAFRAFCKYRDAGAERSLRSLRPATKAPQKHHAPKQASDWSREWGWVERAGSYDAHLDRIAIREAEEVRAETARAWARRREQDRENAWCQAHEIVERLAAKLASMDEQHPIRDYDQLLMALTKAYDLKGSAILDALLDNPLPTEGTGEPPSKSARLIRLIAPPRPERLDGK